MSNPERAFEIVEDLRADIDFEIDDVITQIVRGLPDEYFKILSRHDQMSHLKALLALGVSKIRQEIMLRSDDDRHLAVVGRQNYPGLLARILNRLPNQQEIVGAKIFTSKDHEFIIDLFEFRTEQSTNTPPGDRFDIPEKIAAVAQQVEKPEIEISHFVQQYDPNSPVLDHVPQLVEQFVAFQSVLDSGDTAINLETEALDESASRLTVTTTSARAFQVFQLTAEHLGKHDCDIEQAVLNDFKCRQNQRVSIASFRLSRDTILTQDRIAELRAALHST